MKKTVLILAFALIISTALCACKKAEPDNFDPNKISTDFKDHKITVYDADGEVIQVLECPDAIEGADVKYPDCNFDGYKDISVVYNQGSINSYYYFWIWDNASGKFYESFDLKRVASPSFDNYNKQIFSYERGDGANFISCIYKWKNDDYEELEYVSKKSCFEESGKLRFVQYDYDSGKESIVSDCFVTSESVGEIDFAVSLAEDIAESDFAQKYGQYKTFYMGEADVNGTKCHHVEVSANKAKVVDLYFQIGNIENAFSSLDNGATFSKVTIKEDND